MWYCIQPFVSMHYALHMSVFYGWEPIGEGDGEESIVRGGLYHDPILIRGSRTRVWLYLLTSLVNPQDYC